LLSGVLVLVLAVGEGVRGTPAADDDAFAWVESSQPVAADGTPLALQSIGLGNWLLPEGYMWKLENATAHWQIRQLVKELARPAEARRFWRRWYDTFITRDDIRAIRAAGRLPSGRRPSTSQDHRRLLTQASGWPATVARRKAGSGAAKETPAAGGDGRS
jgi:hypothetical protein